ncbi:hypothetical protein CEXT_521341 [Caerostris extrusa]|uniref:Uncharacterized protein n=1 Tax=Caerostris extrusa TaxID=172846 RepID=A0AAV4M8N3_CAEEX|nr:hypothetical protein CEXT_521341 [Caerostris extrusa]
MLGADNDTASYSQNTEKESPSSLTYVFLQKSSFAYRRHWAPPLYEWGLASLFTLVSLGKHRRDNLIPLIFYSLTLFQFSAIFLSFFFLLLFPLREGTLHQRSWTLSLPGGPMADTRAQVMCYPGKAIDAAVGRGEEEWGGNHHKAHADGGRVKRSRPLPHARAFVKTRSKSHQKLKQTEQREGLDICRGSSTTLSLTQNLHLQ